MAQENMTKNKRVNLRLNENSEAADRTSGFV